MDDGRGGLGLRDLIVPIGALIAGLGGVLIGGWMNRKTLSTLETERPQRDDRREKDREQREDKLDQARAERERGIELDRERRAIDAEKRQVVGALRLQIRRFDTARLAVAAQMSLRHVNPRAFNVIPATRPEEAHLIATWMTHEGWRKLNTAEERLALARSMNIEEDATPGSIARNMRFYEHAGIAIETVQLEITRLLEQMGDPAADVPWPPIREYSTEPEPEETAPPDR